MVLELQFLGAARHVTGTKHLLKVGENQVLLDCGLVQGPRKVADETARTLEIRAIRGGSTGGLFPESNETDIRLPSLR